MINENSLHIFTRSWVRCTWNTTLQKDPTNQHRQGRLTSIDKEVSPKLDSGRDVMAFSPQVLEYGESQFLPKRDTHHTSLEIIAVKIRRLLTSCLVCG